jgi:hypothetical protein
MSETITAAVLVIGDEILSGRTQEYPLHRQASGHARHRHA